jgi:hypothetical protein
MLLKLKETFFSLNKTESQYGYMCYEKKNVYD